jgi:SAM-dependent methyltransferase
VGKEASFISDRFRSNVPYYVTHRNFFPDELIGEVVRRIGLGKSDRVLDLGCGPGYPAIQLAKACDSEIIGMDPDSLMLEAAQEEAERIGVAVDFRLGSSLDVSPALGAFKVVTMARSFHWMDRPATLRALDTIIEKGGAVVLLSDTPEPEPENRWKRALGDMQRQFPGGSLKGGPARHTAVLLDSAFSRLEFHAIIKRLPLTADAIVGRAFSSYRSSPAVLSDRKDEFEAKLRAKLFEFSPAGEFSEILQFGCLIARRPTD